MDLIRIEHIDDVMPHIPADSGIILSKRPDHSVIDYVFTVDHTFDTALARECRGLKFDAEGRIIARPFHKFFNLGEKERPEDIDWGRPHQLFDKLDGSMLHAAMLNGELMLMTRMGVTDQAKKAQALASANVLELSRHLLEGGITPIFEFTAPDNRIVVAYPQTELTLLAARETISGAYLPWAELGRLAATFGVPLVRSLDLTLGGRAEAQAFVMRARAEMGIEGYVIAFEGGHRIKIKTDGYALRHKALSGIQYEKNVMAWVVTNAVDDVLPILSAELAERVVAYRDAVTTGAARLAAMLAEFVRENGQLPRKEFAGKVMKELDYRLRGAAFAILDGGTAEAAVAHMLVTAAISDTKVEAVRDLLQMSWNIEGIALPELEI